MSYPYTTSSITFMFSLSTQAALSGGKNYGLENVGYFPGTGLENIRNFPNFLPHGTPTRIYTVIGLCPQVPAEVTTSDRRSAASDRPSDCKSPQVTAEVTASDRREQVTASDRKWPIFQKSISTAFARSLGIHLICYYCQVIGGILGIYCSKPKSCGYQPYWYLHTVS